MEHSLVGKKCIPYKDLARKAYPCKNLQRKPLLARTYKGNISLQELTKETFPCKILQGKIFLKDLARKACFARILQGSNKE